MTKQEAIGILEAMQIDNDLALRPNEWQAVEVAVKALRNEAILARLRDDRTEDFRRGDPGHPDNDMGM